MFEFDDLRPTLYADGERVGCPVFGCSTRVPMQRRTFKAEPEFLCPAHRIFIGRSTFEYQHDGDNLLWAKDDDRAFLKRAKDFKRESRMARERSEDALSWNVFRHLEQSGRLGPWLTSITTKPEVEPRVHYWSFNAATGKTWAPLAQARTAFGEVDGRGSEPDLVISTQDAHIWVEAKFGSTNCTSPSDVEGARSRYTSGGSRWFASAVNSSFDAIAVQNHRYELLRLWLLGSWAAAQHGKRFELVNLVRQGLEEDVPSFTATHFRQTTSRRVHRITWESLHAFISASSDRSGDDDRLLAYMRNKSLGYSTAGRLVRAFALD